MADNQTEAQKLQLFMEMQEEMQWSNREVADFLGKSVKTVEAWRSSTHPVDASAIKLMRFAVSYARHARSKKVKPKDFDHIA